MSLNHDQQSAWAADANAAGNNGKNDQPQSGAFTAGTVQSGLAGLFGVTSVTADNRNLQLVPETMEKMKELYERIKGSTTNEIQRKTIPTVETLTSTISPTLPGLGMYCEIGDTIYVMAALFATSQLCISSERINIAGMNNMNQQVSIPVAPAQYTNQLFLDKLKEHYSSFAETKGIKNISIINMLVVDVDMLNHPEAGDPKDYPVVCSNFLSAEWEEALLVKTVQEIQASGQVVPNSFINPKQPYGKDGCAEARVSAISGRVTRGRTLTAANMEVIASTISNPNQMGNFQANSREIARVTAIVGLNAVSWEEHQRFVVSQQRNPEFLSQMANFMGGGQGVYPMNYHPLRPVITMETAQAGEMLGNNGGLHPFFYSLYLLMTTNNNFVFAEALRKHAVGSRGNLADMEVRIQQMLQGAQIGGMPNQRAVLDDKKVSDTDFVNTWIRQNVSPHATFQINLLPSGPGTSITNFLFRLASKNNAAEVKTTIALIDAMTNNKMSEIIELNARPGGTGWTPSKPILLPTGMIAVNGLAEYQGKKLNTQEVDEMMISHIKGPKNLPAIEQFLGTQYGSNPNEDFKARCQKLRIELNQSIFDGAVHINGFAQPHIWAPDFMAVLGAAMDSIGQLNVANNLGSWRSSSLVYAPGIGLATAASAGSNSASGSNLGAFFNHGQSFM